VAGAWTSGMATFASIYFCVLVTYYIMLSVLIIKGHTRTWQLLGMEPDVIVVPFTKSQLSWVYQSSEDWQITLPNFTRQISFNYPAGKLAHVFKHKL
jgi:hypothetical protein